MSNTNDKKDIGKGIGLFILGGAVSLLFMGVVIGIALFNLWFHYGYEPVSHTKDYLLIYGATVVLILLIFLAYKLLKKQYLFFARGLWLGALPILVVIYINTILFNDYLYPEVFDQETWISQSPKSYDMARSLVLNDILEGMNKQQLEKLLGNDYETMYSDDSTLAYKLDLASFVYFVIELDTNGTVKHTEFKYFDRN